MNPKLCQLPEFVALEDGHGALEATSTKSGWTGLGVEARARGCWPGSIRWRTFEAADPTKLLITYTPASSFVGADSFTYNVADTFGGTTTGTVSVTVPLVAPLLSTFEYREATVTGNTWML